MEERLQKYLAHAGVASRRKAEEMMLEGRVTINGKTATELGTKVDPQHDAVKVDGKLIHSEKSVYILLNKPKGFICTLDDPEGRPRVVDLIRGAHVRLYPVGRLDFDTEGALLLTNDGELANQLMHPRHEFAKTYEAKVKGVPTPEQIEKLKTGVYIDNRRTSPAKARILYTMEKNSVIEIILREGRNKQVKRMCMAIGHPVLKLQRPAYGPLTVAGMRPGEWRYLDLEEVKALKAATERAPRVERHQVSPKAQVRARRGPAERRPLAERRSPAQRRPRAKKESR